MKLLWNCSFAIATIALSACGEKTLSNVFIESHERPTIFLGAGTVVLISESDTAKVYGPDLCPVANGYSVRQLKPLCARY